MEKDPTSHVMHQVEPQAECQQETTGWLERLVTGEAIVSAPLSLDDRKLCDEYLTMTESWDVFQSVFPALDEGAWEKAQMLRSRYQRLLAEADGTIQIERYVEFMLQAIEDILHSRVELEDVTGYGNGLLLSILSITHEQASDFMVPQAEQSDAANKIRVRLKQLRAQALVLLFQTMPELFLETEDKDRHPDREDAGMIELLPDTEENV